ncbi:MAG: O-antigen ligase family protein [Kofleriaceae bacterium]
MRRRDKITLGLGAAILALSVLAVGGAPRPVLALVGVLVAAGLLVQVSSRRSSRPSPLVWLMAAAIGLTALQLVPLPRGLSAALDPVGQELRRDGEVLLDQASTFTALSRDPASTTYGLAYLLILAGAALLAARIAAAERGRLLIVGAVAAIGTVAATITGLHTLAGAKSLYGLYQPDFATPPLWGPLLNPNHLGCLFALSAVAAAGLVFHDKQATSARGAWAVCALVTVAGALLTLSRGATLALVAGAFVLGAVLIGQHLRGRVEKALPPRLSVNAVAIGVVAVCGLALVVYTSGRGVSEQLRGTSGSEWSAPGSKYMAWRSATHLVAEAPWLGIGRGAFESAFTRVHPASSKITFSHPENEYVQAIVEWGIPGTLLLAVLVAWVAAAAARRWRLDAVTAAALAAIAVVAVQSVVDFGLELPGIGVPTVALLAALLHQPLRETKQAQRKRRQVGRATGAALALAASAALLSPATRRIAEDHRALLSSGQLEPAREVAARHPHDYLAYAVAGDLLARAGDPRAMGLLNHALRLHPTHAGTHRVAARWLLANGRAEQAALEYATALRGATVVAPIVREVVRAFPEPELAASALPLDYPVPEHLAHVLVEAEAPAVALRWLRLVADAHPGAPRIGELLYQRALAAGDLELAERGARLRHQHEASAASLLALGQVLLKRGELDRAAEVLASAASMSGQLDEVAAARLLACDVDLARERWDAARACLLSLREAPQRSGALLLEIARRLERAERGRAAGAR